MAISPFGTTSHEDFASTFAFSDFAGFPAVSLAMDHKPIMIQHHQQQPSPPMTANGSPQLSGPPLASGEDDLDEDDEDDDTDIKSSPSSTNADEKRRGSTDASSGNNSNAQGVKRNGKASSAERRATHNAIERARRESLNGRFLELANALPTMTNVKRPSKSVIVNKSLEWIYESQIREHTLVRENNALRAELNEMRARLQMPPVATPPHTNAYGPQADMAARLKAAQSVPAAAVNAGAEGYFSSLGPFAPLTAMHHPMQYPSFAANHGNGPNSAPLPALPRTLGAAAPGAGGIFAGFGQTPYPTGPAPAQQVKQPASPMSKTGSVSDSGSEHAQSPTNSASGGVNSPANAPAEMPVHTPAALPASAEANLTALQVAHFQAQQQQFAAFAAAVAQQQQSQGGQTAGVPAGWPMATGFMF